MPAGRSLRTKIVASVVAIFACVLLLSGVVTAFALQRALYGQLDSDLHASLEREVAVLQAGRVGLGGATGGGLGSGLPRLGDGDEQPGPGGGRPAGGGDRSLVLVVEQTSSGDTVLLNRVVDEDNSFGTLTTAQIDQLSAAGLSAEPHTVDLGDGVGTHRLVMATLDGSVVGTSGDVRTYVVTGLPVSGVVTTSERAVLILVPVALLSLVAAGAGSAYLVRRNLAPLDRVAATARRVSAQRLDTGAVEMVDRVEERDTDPATEVGQVGLALNNLLDTMEAALSARHGSEQRVRQFVADASHELRTPLASIRGYAELGQRETEPVAQSVRHALRRIQSESLRMQGLVEDLLLLARLDEGRPLERARVDVTLLCLDAVGDARVAGPDHRWILDLPDEPVEVVGDEGRLRQVLTNLLANARTHTPVGTTVTTSLRGSGETVELAVVDDGPGIPEALQANVFERFARGDDSRSRQAGSTGLGLSIVDAVVRAHGGSVELESEPGRTAFVVRLPARAAVAA